MDFITSLVLTVNVISAIAVIVLVLMQHGKGADMGAAFGSGSAGSVFGSSGSANFLSRTTGVCATVFFVTSMALVLLTAPKQTASIMSTVQPTAVASQVEGQKIPD
ncbi:preprotein translocase subunit SecG [Deefgea salmonis]|uniref:Protein-export membrane protein SecG n=1 Tax=Deefgea salmonis TaxID=2875502 RepID=A0ABS8BI36_9NEIS|nr:preprotein translocase subunit SecG [Deefgea salmonis]MCB5195373.1 preprotein translocase subunit SecG [Deefgea salmonis]